MQYTRLSSFGYGRGMLLLLGLRVAHAFAFAPESLSVVVVIVVSRLRNMVFAEGFVCRLTTSLEKKYRWTRQVMRAFLTLR